MEMVYRKQASVVLFLLTIVFAIYSVFVVANLFYYGATLFSAAFYVNCLFALLCIAESVVLLITYIAYRKNKLDPQKSGIRLGIIGFVYTPITLAWGFSSSFAFPMSFLDWPYYGAIAASVIALALSIIFIAITNKDYQKGYTGLLIYHNHIRVIIFILAQNILYYLISVARIFCLFKVAEASEQGDPSASNAYMLAFLIIALVCMVLSALIVLVVFYFSFVIFVSGKENIPLALKHGLPATKRMLKKYEIGFWFGVVFNIILAATGVVSAIRLSEAYIGLAILYGVITIIKIPSFFWRRYLEKKYYKDDYTIFKKKHLISLYIGIDLLILGILAIIFGTGSSTKFDSSFGAFVIYVVFVPLVIIRLIVGLRKLIKAANQGDPFESTRSFVEILMSLFVLGNTAYMISGLLSKTSGGDTWYVVATALGYVLNVYVLLISVFTIVMGILGAAGKLRKQYDYFEDEIIKVNRCHLQKIVQ